MNKNQSKLKLLSSRFWSIQRIIYTIFLLQLSIPLYSQNAKEAELDKLLNMSLEELINMKVGVGGCGEAKTVINSLFPVKQLIIRDYMYRVLLQHKKQYNRFTII